MTGYGDIADAFARSASPRLSLTLDGGPAIDFARGAIARVGAAGRLPGPVGIVASRRGLADARSGGLDVASVAIFDDVRPHASAQLCAEAHERLTGVRSIVAIGGGSAIGIGKAVAARAQAGLTAVPTTYSGSELTMLYGITEEQVKTVRKDPAALPETVVYDPALTDGFPLRASGASLMNCLAHLLECGWHDAQRGPVRAIALAGTRQLALGLGAQAAGDDAGARDRLMAAGMCGGLALAHGQLGVHHAICHAVGGRTGASHGEINAIVLPAVARAVFAQTAPAQDELIEPLRAAGAGHGPSAAVIEALRARWELPSRLRDVGLDASDLTAIADDVHGHLAGADGPQLDRPATLALMRELW